jgi:hypothetical protein
MKSSRNRSRSKGNRNRSVGNIVNRVFDSSGPEGKVRGTPQQIIDKYNQLTRDAQLGNDRVAAENFQQHAEHYLRMLSEAQREQDARREQHTQQNNQQNQQKSQSDAQSGAADDTAKPADKGEKGDRGDAADKGGAKKAQGSDGNTEFNSVIETGSDEAGLVETPENTPKPKRSRTRRPKKTDEAPKAETPDAAPAQAAPDDGPDSPPQEAAE